MACFREDFRGRDGPDDRGRRYNGRDNFGRYGGGGGAGGGGGGFGRDGSRERDMRDMRDRDWDGYQGRESPEYHEYGNRRGSPPPQDGKPLSKTMYIKRHINDDVDDEEIDRRCGAACCGCAGAGPRCPHCSPAFLASRSAVRSMLASLARVSCRCIASTPHFAVQTDGCLWSCAQRQRLGHTHYCRVHRMCAM